MSLHDQSVIWIALAISTLSLHLVLSYLVWRHVPGPMLLVLLASVTLVTTFFWLGLNFVVAMSTGVSSHPFTWPEREVLTNIMGLFGLAKLSYDLLNKLGIGSSLLSVVLSLYVEFFLLSLIPVLLTRSWRKMGPQTG